MTRPEMDRAALKRATAKGMLVSFAAQIAKFLMIIVYQVCLARLLVPDDFGLVAMVAPLLALMQLFTDLGLSQATVQRSDLSDGQLNLLFRANVLVSVALTGVTVMLAPLVAGFFKEPKLMGLTAVSSVIFAINGLGGQQVAILNRD